MTYICQLPSSNVLETLILSSGYGSLSCIWIGQNVIDIIFVLSGSFRMSHFLFYHSLTSVHSDIQYLV